MSSITHPRKVCCARRCWQGSCNARLRGVLPWWFLLGQGPLRVCREHSTPITQGKGGKPQAALTYLLWLPVFYFSLSGKGWDPTFPWVSTLGTFGLPMTTQPVLLCISTVATQNVPDSLDSCWQHWPPPLFLCPHLRTGRTWNCMSVSYQHQWTPSVFLSATRGS